MSQRADRTSPPLETAEEVRDFYERYPCPPPIDDLLNISASGRILRDGPRSITSFGPTTRTAKTIPSNLHSRLHRGAYRALQSRRVYTQKGDGLASMQSILKMLPSVGPSPDPTIWSQ
jgi:hypothetical protein